MFTLPGYKITEEIHETNRFRVYRGKTIQNQSPVMIKVLKTGANPADIAKLMHEYEITRSLRNRGIIKPIRLEWAGMTVALIMEDSGAIPLRQHLQTSSPELQAFLSMAIQLAETLGNLHQNGVIHRNINPDAIVMHPGTGDIKITDFSMATLLSRKAQNESMPNPCTGTLAYMSPEQIGRTSKAIDQRSDLYSLGVVFYEILAKQLPLQAGSHMQWIHAHMAKKPVYPGEIKPAIPPTISAIIMKLLAKAAGERYQSAFGLLADLEECRRQWVQTGIIGSFALGREDLSGLFQLPHKLYGREKEIAVLTSAFACACSGQPGLLLVHGSAGTGKTVLVHETIRPLAAERGYFITGKFDQLQWNIPYAPFIQALGDLMRQLLTESQENLAEWKKRLLRALGRSGAVITEVIPEVELIVGPQPPVEALMLWEAQNRFLMVFRSFILAFAQKEHPLVIFLDDLQWADQASLSLIRYLSKDTDSRYLLVIGAYRDNEVTGTHPLLFTLEEMENTEIAVQHLPLAPLDPICANQYVADTLHCDKEQSQLLTDILYRKTGGNPFFLGQLLLSAYEENLLKLSTQDGCLKWDSDSIREMPMTDDVINLMLGKLQKLPEETLKVLKLAACIGNVVDLKILSFAAWKTPGQAVADLWPAIVEGLVLLVTDKNKNIYRVADNYPVIDFVTKYEFLHDRVQQAAYSLVLEEEKKEAHLKIGRLILAFTTEDLLDENIFMIMDHLNRGLDLITDLEEKIQLAGYNLLAGRKAKAATAYDSALNYFKFGMEFLPDNAWDTDYRLTFELHAERSQSEYLCAHYDKAEQLFDLLLSKAKTDLEKADIYVTKILLNSSMERYHETLQLGIKGLSLLGVELSANPGKIAFIKEIILAKWRLRSQRDFTDLQEMTDPVQKRVMLLFLAQAGAARMINPELYALIILKISNLSIKYGNSEFASIGYAGYSFFNGSVLGDYKKGREFEQAALKLVEKSGNCTTLCSFYFLLGASVSHWTEHGKISVNYLQKAVNYGIESGNSLVMGFALNLMIENKYLLGVSLDELYKECRSYYKRTRAVRLLHYQLLIESMTGCGDNTTCDGLKFMRTNIPDEMSPINKELRAFKNGEINNNMTYDFFKMQLCYLDGDYANALCIGEKAQQNLTAIRGFLLSAEYVFYYSLSITARYDNLSFKEQRKYRSILKQNQRQMKKWSNSCPANFLHKQLLIAAETARLDGQDSEAMSLYDHAIESAHEHGYLQNEAIASELAAKYYLTKGRRKIARVYLTDACQGYYKWGAVRKVRMLQSQYPHLLAGILMEEQKLEAAEILQNTFRLFDVCDYDATDNLDLYTIQKAVHRISEDTDPETLLKSFLEIAIENAGADKGYLILEKEENLLIEAAKESDNDTTAVVAPLPLQKNTNISQAMVRYVARTLETVVLNDMGQTGIFAKDSYIAQSRSKSIACLPLLFQGIPVGVLYLENSLMAGVFTPDRLELLKLLSRQMAYVQKLQSFLERDNSSIQHETTPPLIEPLTERELDVLNLIAEGMSNKEIALGLYLTVNTVKTHILNIYGKLQVNRRMQAVTRARELKLLKKAKEA